MPNDGEPYEICDGIKASFMVAGHIMGASLVLVELVTGHDAQRAEMQQSSIRIDIRFLFSGDLGHYDQPIVKDPAPPPDCDYLMCESTYGNRLHGDIDSETQMAEIINEAARETARS